MAEVGGIQYPTGTSSHPSAAWWADLAASTAQAIEAAKSAAIASAASASSSGDAATLASAKGYTDDEVSEARQALEQALAQRPTTTAVATSIDNALDTRVAPLEDLTTTGRLSEASLTGTFATHERLTEVATGQEAALTDSAVTGALTGPGSTTQAALRNSFLPKALTEPHTVEYGHCKIDFIPSGLTLRGPVITTEQDNGPVDYGSRLTIHSSHGGTSLNQRGEGLRMMVDTDQAKNMIAWYDNFTNPGSPKVKAWIGYHYGTAPDIVHDHISIETPDSTGGLYSRFGLSTTPSDVCNIDFAGADVQFSASAGGSFRIAANAEAQTTTPRDIIFATGVDHEYIRRRWALRADTTAETGTADGSNFRIMRYANNGDSLPGTVLAITRSNGHIGIGAEPNSNYRLNVEAASFGVIRLASTASSASSGLVRTESSTATGLLLDSLVTGETFRRFAVDATGRLSWGSGTAAYDTQLYRGGPGNIQTVHDIEVASASRGLILRDSNGVRYRLGVHSTGTLTVTAI